MQQVGVVEMNGIWAVMIVKNEENVIERCIEAAADKIDGFVIFDTGSTDNTTEKIEEIKKRLDLNIICKQSEWINFGANRTEAFDFAKNIEGCKYMIVLDADDVLEGTFSINHEIDVGTMLVNTDGIEHVHRRLFNTKFDWKYVGAVHEYPVTCGELAGTEKEEMIISAWINHMNDGGSHADGMKKSEEYMKLLESSDQNDPRTIFYMAQTLRGMGRLAEAKERYKQRIAMGGYRQEVIMSALCIARIQHMIGQNESALMWYMRTYEMDTERTEALKGIIKISKQLDMFNVGLWAGEKAIKMRKIKRTPLSKLFYEGNNIDEYTLMDLGLCAYYANPANKRIAKQAWMEITRKGKDAMNVNQAEKNLKWI